LCALATDAIRGIGIDPVSMVSGAGHDAMILAERVPSTMIFLRSPGGISHHPDESVRPEDVENALAAGLAFLRNFDSCYAPRVKEQSTPHV
jgi:allantoate deiminase